MRKKEKKNQLFNLPIFISFLQFQPKTAFTAKYQIYWTPTKNRKKE